MVQTGDDAPEEPKGSLISSVRSIFSRKRTKKEAVEAEGNKTEAKDSAWKGGMNK